MWRGFPAAFCETNGLSGFVFSRYGMAARRRSRRASTGRGLHAAAGLEVIPALSRSGHRPARIFGHSDGGSIALLHASRFEVAGVVAVAPHLFVEPISIASIEKAKVAYETTDLRERLGRYHDDPDSAFRGWNDAWLSPAFRAWNIEADIGSITCPVLAVQGEDDEYGTLEQVRAIKRRLPKTRLFAMAECGHSPHRDQPGPLTLEAGRFILAHASSFET